MVLYVNACVRQESRTDKIAKELLKRLGGNYQELKLSEQGLKPLSEEKLNKRMALVSAGDYSDPMFNLAKQFAAADQIVIGAPFWDGSFPSALKVYIENIYCIGIVSEYDEKAMPRGLCKADKLYYVTTAGGPLITDFGYDYIKAIATTCFGIKETKLIKAEMLDVDGFDAQEILGQTIAGLMAN